MINLISLSFHLFHQDSINLSAIIMDSIGMSAGGRLAKINTNKENRRRITSMMNTVEAKRLNFIKKQIEEDKSTALYNMERFVIVNLYSSSMIQL